MTLEEAREIGRDCGLGTDEECVMNIYIHALSFFLYDKMEKELAELQREFEESKEVI